MLKYRMPVFFNASIKEKAINKKIRIIFLRDDKIWMFIINVKFNNL